MSCILWLLLLSALHQSRCEPDSGEPSGQGPTKGERREVYLLLSSSQLSEIWTFSFPTELYRKAVVSDIFHGDLEEIEGGYDSEHSIA